MYRQLSIFLLKGQSMSSNSPKKPKYLMLQTHLEQQIRQGILAHGDRMPSEVELCHQFNVSRGTVRAAFQRLTDEGLCNRRRGDGTYVSLRASGGSASTATGTVFVALPCAQTLALIHPFYESMLQGMQDELADRMQLRCVPLSNEKSLENFEEEFREAKGVIASGALPVEMLKKIRSYNTNLTTYQYRCHSLPSSSVTVDNVHAGHLACTHLIRQGVKRILFVNLEGVSTEFTERLMGAQEALREAGKPNVQFKTLHLASGTGEELSLFDAMYEEYQPDAVIGCKDVLAVNLMGRLMHKRDRKFKTRVMGFDDLFIGSILKPSLSSVSQPAYQLGVHAARITLRTHHNSQKEHYVMQPCLVIRESSQEGV